MEGLFKKKSLLSLILAGGLLVLIQTSVFAADGGGAEQGRIVWTFDARVWSTNSSFPLAIPNTLAYLEDDIPGNPPHIVVGTQQADGRNWSYVHLLNGEHGPDANEMPNWTHYEDHTTGVSQLQVTSDIDGDRIQDVVVIFEGEPGSPTVVRVISGATGQRIYGVLSLSKVDLNPAHPLVPLLSARDLTRDAIPEVVYSVEPGLIAVVTKP
jgi:hypothetical protein